jgi:hypothetical protein
MLTRLDHGLCRLNRAGDNGLEFDELLSQVNLAPHDTRHIQQVIDKSNEVLHLPLNHLVGLLAYHRIHVRHFKNLQCIANRRQGIAKLVR